MKIKWREGQTSFIYKPFHKPFIISNRLKIENGNVAHETQNKLICRNFSIISTQEGKDFEHFKSRDTFLKQSNGNKNNEINKQLKSNENVYQLPLIPINPLNPKYDFVLKDILNFIEQNGILSIPKSYRTHLRLNHKLSSREILELTKYCKSLHHLNLTKEDRQIIKSYLMNHKEETLNIISICTSLQPFIKVKRKQLFNAIDNEVRKLSKKNVSNILKEKIHEFSKNLNQYQEIPPICDQLQNEFPNPRWQLYSLLEKALLKKQRKIVKKKDRDLIVQYINNELNRINYNTSKAIDNKENNVNTSLITINMINTLNNLSNTKNLTLNIINELQDKVSLSKNQIYNIAYSILRKKRHIAISSSQEKEILAYLSTIKEVLSFEELVNRTIQHFSIQHIPKDQISSLIRNFKSREERVYLNACKLEIRDQISKFKSIESIESKESKKSIESKESKDFILNLSKQILKKFSNIPEEKILNIIYSEYYNQYRKKQLYDRYKSTIRKEIEIKFNDQNSLDHAEILEDFIQRNILPESLFSLTQNQNQTQTQTSDQNQFFQNERFLLILNRRILKRLIHDEIQRIKRKSIISKDLINVIKKKVNDKQSIDPEMFYSKKMLKLTYKSNHISRENTISPTFPSTPSTLLSHPSPSSFSSEDLDKIIQDATKRRKEFLKALQSQTNLSTEILSYLVWNQVKNLSTSARRHMK